MGGVGTMLRVERGGLPFSSCIKDESYEIKYKCSAVQFDHVNERTQSWEDEAGCKHSPWNKQAFHITSRLQSD